MHFADLLLIGAVSAAQVVRVVVWSGMVIATIALLVLMRTRWGQSQPLRKCIVLSTLVHLLFGIYTTTVNIVVASIGKGNSDAPTWIAIDDGDDVDSDYAALADRETESDESSPWNGFAEPAAMESLLAAPRLREDLLAGPPSTLPGVADSPLQQIAAREARPEAQDPSMQVVPATMPAVKATAIEAPAAGRSEPSAEPPLAADVPPPVPAPGASSGPPDLLPDPINTLANLQPPRAQSETLSTQGSTSSDRIAVLGASAGSGATGGLSAALVPIVKGGAAGQGGARVPVIMQGRMGDDRLRRAIAHGGSEETEAAVIAALQWLVDHQAADGRWDASVYEAGREVLVQGHDRRGAGSHADSGITGLALLALLAHGNTHLQGEHPRAVQRGLEWLLSIQAADGNLGGDAKVFERMYCHAMATCALSEAYAMSRDDRLAEPVRRAINYCIDSQDPRGGGWRYQPGDAGDTSQLGWQVMALKSAELAGLEIPTHTRDGIIRYLKSVASGRTGGLACYKPGHRVTHAMTAEALVCRQFLGMSRENPAGHEASQYLLTELPGESEDNVYYWYYGTLGMFQLQGESWNRWNSGLQDALLKTQRRSGDARGSWDPDKVWGAYGGRVYSTALSALCLEVYYRFLPLYIEAANRETRAP